MKDIICCNICNKKFKSIKGLAIHLRSHNIKNTKEYYLKYLGTKGICPNCNNDTAYLDLSRGYRQCCSIQCMNEYKAKNPDFILKISKILKSKNINRKNDNRYQSENFRNKISVISKERWEKHREQLEDIFKDLDFRKLQAVKSSNKTFLNKKGEINNIIYESSAEKKFIELCIHYNWNIRRFGLDQYEKQKIVILENGKGTIPDYVCSELLVEVKDFHPWFKKELFSGLCKYKFLRKWCIENEYFFIFWFPKLGFIHLDELLKIKNEKQLKKFLREFPRKD